MEDTGDCILQAASVLGLQRQYHRGIRTARTPHCRRNQEGLAEVMEPVWIDNFACLPALRDYTKFRLLLAGRFRREPRRVRLGRAVEGRRTPRDSQICPHRQYQAAVAQTLCLAPVDIPPPPQSPLNGRTSAEILATDALTQSPILRLHPEFSTNFQKVRRKNHDQHYLNLLKRQ